MEPFTFLLQGAAGTGPWWSADPSPGGWFLRTAASEEADEVVKVAAAVWIGSHITLDVPEVRASLGGIEGGIISLHLTVSTSLAAVFSFFTGIIFQAGICPRRHTRYNLLPC